TEPMHDDSMDEGSRELMSLVHSTCPEHSVHLPFIGSDGQTCSTQTIQASHSAYSHHSPVPLHCPIPIRPLPRQGSVPFDSVSFHLHPSTHHSIRLSHSQEGPSTQEYVSSTKSSPTPKSRFSGISPLPGLFFKDSRSYGASLDDSRVAAKFLDDSRAVGPSSHTRRLEKESLSTDCTSGQLTKQELWDLLQATEAELRARLVQAESERDHFARQLHLTQHQSAIPSHNYEAYESLAVSSVMNQVEVPYQCHNFSSMENRRS
ncbi:hypothetical protein FHG87_016606, partial [Trinorchestia longiramus]